MLYSEMKRTAVYTSGDADRLLQLGRDWNFHGEVTKEHLHSLHPYPAKFIPQIPRKAILEWSSPGDLVYDPFCGCGTTLLEASLLGRPSIGTDNNSVAILVSKAKTANFSKSSLKRLQKFARDLPTRLKSTRKFSKLVPADGVVDYWFNKSVMERLAAIKGAILECREPERTLLMAVFSSIIVRVSYQDSDTRYAKVPKEIRAQDVETSFIRKLQDAIESIPAVLVADRAKATAILADAREVPFVDSSSVALIVTSPPYLNAYDYHKYHRQRIHWIDGDVKFARDLEIGSHDEFTKPRAKPDQYFVDMQACFTEWRRVLKKKGRCVVLIGDAIVSKNPVKVADEYIELAKRTGLKLEGRWIRELQATKRSFNVRNSRISHEHVLLFGK